MAESCHHSALKGFSINLEHVISPSTDRNDNNAAQAPPVAGYKVASEKPVVVFTTLAYARSADYEVLAKALDILFGIDARFRKNEAIQARIDEGERIRAADESGLSASMLGAEIADRLHGKALELSDLRERQGSQQARG